MIISKSLKNLFRSQARRFKKKSMAILPHCVLRDLSLAEHCFKTYKEIESFNLPDQRVFNLTVLP